MAATVTGFIDRLQFGTDDEHQIAIGSSAFGTCNSLANASTKEVVIPGFVLKEGTTIHVKFSNSNTASSPKLRVKPSDSASNNDCPEVNLLLYDGQNVGTDNITGWPSGSILTLTYDGTSWIRDLSLNSDESVKQTGVSTNDSFPILFKHTTGTSDETNGVKFGNTNSKIVTINPSEGSITAPGGFDGKATSAGTADVAESVDWSNIENVPSTFTPSSHTHGNIQNDGTIDETNNFAIGNGDTLIIADNSSNDLLVNSMISFDATTTTKALTPKGTWENVVNSIGGHSGVVTLADLGLSNALHFIGQAVNETLEDGSALDPFSSAQNPPTYNGSTGDVVLDKFGVREYVWLNNYWELLGFSASESYSSASVASTESQNFTWISNVEQTTDGRISATKSYINILPIEHGGTSVSSFTKNQVILSNNPSSGNDATALTSRAFIDATFTSNVLDARAISDSNNFITEAVVRAGLPSINNSDSYTKSTTIYAPTTGGIANHILIGNGATSAPVWTSEAALLTSDLSDVANTAAYTILTLGNATATTSSSNHSEGKIELYSAGTGSHTIKGKNTNTDYEHILPNHSGRIVSTHSTDAVGSNTQSVYVSADGVITAITYTPNVLYAGGTAVTNYSYSDSLVATGHYADSDHLGVNIDDWPTEGVGQTPISDALYVNGDTTIDGVVKIIDDTDTTETLGVLTGAALLVDGGVGIIKQLQVGQAATLKNNLSVAGISTLTGNTSIGADANASSNYILTINGSTLISDAAELKVINSGSGSSIQKHLEFIPVDNGKGEIGTSSKRWQSASFTDTIELVNSTSSITLDAAGSGTAGSITISATNPKIVFDTTASGGADWNLYNNSGAITLDTSGASLIGTTTEFKLTPKLWINSPSNYSSNYTLYIGGDTMSDGDIIPTLDSNNIPDKTLGSTTNRWANVYIGGADTYGDAYLPVYWNNGIPANLNGIVQRANFTFNANLTVDLNSKISVTLTHAAYTHHYGIAPYVIAIVVTSGAQYLISQINWETSSTSNDTAGTITLSMDGPIGGTIQGYILTVRACTLNFS